MSILLIGAWYVFGTSNEVALTSALAEYGTVSTAVTVSGSVTVDDIIPLSFPQGGTVSALFVSRGDAVATGTIIATVGDAALQAEYAGALAEVTRTRAVRDELTNGQTTEESAVTASTITNAETALSNTIRTEAARVEAARTTLFSTGLTAVAINADTTAPPPTVTGSYTCSAAGTYIITPYQSGTQSGYSYRFSGLETGTNNASINQPAPLGDCGLRLQFADDATYTGKTYTISIPNSTAALYATNQALYEQALAQQESSIASAERALALALDQGSVATAGTRIERLIAANAVVSAAEARLAQVSAQLSDRALRAPRSGVITEIAMTPGQTVTPANTITLYAPAKTTVTARIPEKDIAALTPNQKANMQFDAQPDITIAGTVSFLSPVQTIISGTPYYEAVVVLEEVPQWLRPGMQADVRIITTVLTDTVRIPRLFLQDDIVFIRRDGIVSTTSPEVLLVGTDGYVAVSGITAGDELVLP